MDFQDYFPVWNRLTAAQQNQLLNGLTSRKVKKGTILHNGSADCTGLLLIKTGQLRAYILSGKLRFTACSTGTCACSPPPVF